MSHSEFTALGGHLAENTDAFDDISKSKLSSLGHDTTIPGCGERVHVIMGWLYELIATRIQTGGLQVHPVLMQRVYTDLSTGLTAYEHCRKLNDT